MSDIKDIATPLIEKYSSSSTNNKALYIVTTEDPTVKSKRRVYVAEKLSQHPATVELAGFEVAIDSNIAQLKTVKSFNDAVELARSENAEKESILLPWHRIIRIKVVHYTVTK